MSVLPCSNATPEREEGGREDKMVEEGRRWEVGKEVERKIKGRGINTSMKKQAETVTKGIEMRRKGKRAKVQASSTPILLH